MVTGVLMARKASKGEGLSSLEDRFIQVLNSNKIQFASKLFNLGSKLYLPDFVFGYLIVEVEDCVSENRAKVIKEFKKSNGGYKVVLLTSDEPHCLDAAQDFDEVFDMDSVDALIVEIKKYIEPGMR